MGVPAVDVSVVPLMKNLPNVLDLPLISGFVRDAIAAGVRLPCAFIFVAERGR
jgi:Ca2+-dependent lipid-binding protein